MLLSQEQIQELVMNVQNILQYMVHMLYYYVVMKHEDQMQKKTLNAYVKKHTIHTGGHCEFVLCNLASISNVEEFAKKYEAKKFPLHILINNAGFSYPKCKFTKDNINSVWQVNYLSHFYLTYLLLPLMIKSCGQLHKKNGDVGRIVQVSSFWHNKGKINFDLLESDKETQEKAYEQHGMYGNTKLAQIMHATYLQNQIFTKYNIPLIAASTHPGVVDTNIWKTNALPLHMRLLLFILTPWLKIAARNPQAGAQCSLYCAMAPVNNDNNNNNNKSKSTLVPGAYQNNMIPTITRDAERQSVDFNSMKKLWNYCHKILNLKDRTKEDYLSYF